MALLTREAILAAQDRRFIEVEVPEWGGSVRLGSMPADLVFAYTDVPKDQSMAWLIAKCAVDASGADLFTEEDVQKLRKKNPAAILRVFKAATKLNVLTPEAAEEVRGN